MRISDWSSDVCSSDLICRSWRRVGVNGPGSWPGFLELIITRQTGTASLPPFPGCLSISLTFGTDHREKRSVMSSFCAGCIDRRLEYVLSPVTDEFVLSLVCSSQAKDRPMYFPIGRESC